MMNKKIKRVVYIAFALFVIWQVYCICVFKGNLHFTVCNESENDTVAIAIFIDGKRYVNDCYYGTYGFYSTFLIPKTHTAVIVINGEKSTEIKFNTFLFTEIYVGYQGEKCIQGYGTPYYFKITKWMIWQFLA